jgi:hypothetical protein
MIGDLKNSSQCWSNVTEAARVDNQIRSDQSRPKAVYLSYEDVSEYVVVDTTKTRECHGVSDVV